METFDWRIGRWEYLSPMNTARHSFGAVVKNNSIYAIGGYRNKRVEIFDIRTNTWRYGPPLNFSTDRVNVNAVISDNGYIFAIGSASYEEYLSVLVDNQLNSLYPNQILLVSILIAICVLAQLFILLEDIIIINI